MIPELYPTNHDDFYLKIYKNPKEPGTWTTVKVEIWQHSTEKQVGEYERNYSFLDTFWVFDFKGETYVLYSKQYTATRVLKFVDGEFVDWCGEENSTFGFCPVDFFVPVVTNWNSEDLENVTLDFGFVAGCVWVAGEDPPGDIFLRPPRRHDHDDAVGREARASRRSKPIPVLF